MFFKENCIEHDAVDIYKMLVELATEPRSVMAANIARVKNKRALEINQ